MSSIVDLKRFRRDPSVLSKTYPQKIHQRLPKLQIQVENLRKLSFHSRLLAVIQRSSWVIYHLVSNTLSRSKQVKSLKKGSSINSCSIFKTDDILPSL